MANFSRYFRKRDIVNFLRRIFEGSITTQTMKGTEAEKLFEATFKVLNSGVKIAFTDKLDKALLKELQDNIYIFSGAKTYTQVKDISSLITDNGKIRSFSEFKKLAKAKFDTYNVDYLSAEYETAVGQAQSAVKWQQIESESKLFPYLQRKAVMDANTSPECVILNEIIAPVEDPIWRTRSPLTHFRCFTPETLILNGNKDWQRIDSLKVGEFVIGGSGKKQEIEFIHVNKIESEIFRLSIKNNSVSSTENHRFLTAKGWICAKNISVGDILIQNIEVGFFNKAVCAINNFNTVFRYLLMSVKRQRESRPVNALNANIHRGNEYVNKSFINKFVSDTKNMFGLKKIKNFFFNISKWCVILLQVFGIFINFIYNCISHLVLSRFNKHRVINSHPFRRIGSFFSKQWMRVIHSIIAKRVSNFLFSFFGINPLCFYSFAAVSGSHVKVSEQTHKGSVVDGPLSANFPERKFVDEIGNGEGFTNGQPLNSFDSLNNFLLHSFFHRRFVNVEKIDKHDYVGQIYNISVKNDESYITNVGVVHNCRCILTQIDKYEDVKLSSQGKKDAAIEKTKHINPLFKGNAGIDKVIFNETHPYFDIEPKDKALAKRNFNL